MLTHFSEKARSFPLLESLQSWWRISPVWLLCAYQLWGLVRHQNSLADMLGSPWSCHARFSETTKQGAHPASRELQAAAAPCDVPLKMQAGRVIMCAGLPKSFQWNSLKYIKKWSSEYLCLNHPTFHTAARIKYCIYPFPSPPDNLAGSLLSYIKIKIIF